MTDQLDIEVGQFDGGLNTRDAPNKIGDYESPDCLNVVFSNEGAVQTRSGTTYTGASIGSSNIDGGISYNQTMAIWGGGRMYRYTATTWTQVTTASGKFASGANVAAVTYQGISFMSDGTNGPYRWEGGENFYMMGVGTPSAPTGASNVATAASQGIVTGNTVYYKVAFVNSHVVTGGPGSASVAVTPATTANINVTGVPLGSGLYGVSARKIYRATSLAGTYGLVKTLSDNVTTSFTDTVSIGSEGSAAVADGTAPTPWTTVKEHKERIFFDDSTTRSLLRYTDYQNPYISKAANFFSVANNKGENITAIGVQDDFVTVFYDKSMIWVYDLVDPSTDTSWTRVLSPVNLGIVGPNAFTEIPNGIMFVGIQNGKLSGIHVISGLDVTETASDKLRTRNIAAKIAPTILNWPSTLLSKIAMKAFENRVYFACPRNSTSTILDGILYFDIDRLVDDEPGSWAPWTGIKVQNLWIHNGVLYGGSSNSDGRVEQFNSGAYTNADGTAINSYFWSKQFGGEKELGYWTKDGRWTDIWYGTPADYEMDYRFRTDGDEGGGTSSSVDLSPGGATWGSFTWGDGTLYSAGISNKESRIYIGPMTFKRIQHGFTNQNTTTQSFKVFSIKNRWNLRRKR